jgi:hypothetical protein
MTPHKGHEQEAGWRPIETAPKDGTTVILYCAQPKVRYRLTVAKWVATWKAWQSQPGAWTVSPTHWMPLPAPPASQEQEK